MSTPYSPRVLRSEETSSPEAVEEAMEAASALLLQPEVSTGDAKVGVQRLAEAAPVVLFFDEFDRLTDQQAKTQVVDLIKALSDHAVRATIVLVGVADSVDELVAEHESITRALAQILMPRMSPDELAQIIDRGLETAGMSIAEGPRQRIIGLSQGLPHYTHLLAQESAIAAIGDSRTHITREDVALSVNRAILRAQQHIVRLYHSATTSPQQNIYPQVLLACALSPADERGLFAPGDVREPLSQIMGRRYEIPAFARHLTRFAETRGPVLQKTPGKRPRYRFREPLLVPYVLMKGLSAGMLTEESLDRLIAAETPAVSS